MSGGGSWDSDSYGTATPLSSRAEGHIDFVRMDEQFSVRGQNAYLTINGVLDAGGTEGHKLRISIRTDTYEAQCWAKVDRWDRGKWHFVADIQPSLMATDRDLAYQQGPTKWAFEDDINVLLKQALFILR